ncbi:MAG: hypothetical protein HRU36_04950 [Rickettsiales bacterium]|nr:hypothetical protein [Rickettsiales bacterium]
MTKYFESSDKITEAIKKFNSCQADLITKVSKFIDDSKNKDEICNSIKVDEDVLNDEGVLRHKKVIGVFEKKLSEYDISMYDCEIVLCDSMTYENIFGRQYKSFQECVTNNDYGCEDKCSSTYNSSPVSEQELLDMVRSSVITEEGVKHAVAIGALCNGIIGVPSSEAVADTVFESLCVNCMGVAHENLPTVEHSEL